MVVELEYAELFVVREEASERCRWTGAGLVPVTGGGNASLFWFEGISQLQRVLPLAGCLIQLQTFTASESGNLTTDLQQATSQADGKKAADLVSTFSPRVS